MMLIGQAKASGIPYSRYATSAKDDSMEPNLSFKEQATSLLRRYKTLDFRPIRSKGVLEGPWGEVLAFFLIIGVVLGGSLAMYLSLALTVRH
jgi:hypothetical protein